MNACDLDLMATGKPRLALVIGSGGVRSVAALGACDALREAGIAPDLIVGCSAGALFGSLIAMGMAPCEATRLAMRLWTREITREPRPFAITRMVLPRLGRFDADFSLRRDRHILARMREAFGERRIEELPVRLRVVATAAADGERVVLDTGDLVQALRASVALPFMFSAVHVDGRRLVDGFLSDPLPVQVAADAAVVIALGFDAPMPRRVDRPTRMLSALTSTMTNNLMQARLQAAAAIHPRLITIVPRPPGRVGLFDTDAMPTLIEVGRAAVAPHLDRIRALLADSAGGDVAPGAAEAAAGQPAQA